MATGRSILRRIVLGSILTIAAAGLLALDWYAAIPLADVKGHVLACAAVVLVVLAFLEIGRLARAAGAGVLTGSGLLGVIVLATVPVWRQLFPFLLLDDVWFFLGAIVMLTFLEQMVRYRVDGAIGRISATLLAVLYLGAGMALMLGIRMVRGVPTLALFLAGVKSADVAAYFVGTAVGRHKLIAWLSPGKSWEGLAGALAGGAGASVLAAWLLGLHPPLATGMSLRQAAVFGAVIALAGQFADLCESLLKRAARAKDSGALVPEFGGVLDILDSPLLAAPAAYLLLELML